MVDIQVSQCMNDILNQVEAREWKRVTQQRDTLLRHKKSLSQKIKNMEDDWYVATEKIGQENSDLHNEVKSLKSRNMDFARVIKEYESRNNDLQHKNYDLEVALEERDDEIASLFEDIKEKRLPKGWHMVEAEGSLKASRDHMKAVEDKINLTKENEKLKEEIKQLRNPEAGKNRLQMAFDDIKRLQQQVEVLKRRNKRITKENENLKLWCLSDEMIKQTSAETIEEFEKDVRDNWDEIENLKETQEPQYPDMEYQFIYEIGSYNMMRGATDKDYADCWEAKLTGRAKTYKEWIKLTDK